MKPRRTWKLMFPRLRCPACHAMLRYAFEGRSRIQLVEVPAAGEKERETTAL